MFHIVFPTATIGLGLYLVIIETLWLLTKDELYYRMCRFWGRVLAINFGVGVVSGGGDGIRVRHQLGPIFRARRQRLRTAPILRGPDRLLPGGGVSGDHAFRLEPGEPSIHFLATCLVAGALILSALWIVAANSWDADAGRISHGGWAVYGRRLQGRHLQSIDPGSVQSHGGGSLRDIGIRRRRHRGVLPA